MSNKKELDINEILKGLDETTANMQLPDYKLRNYYLDEQDRVIWLDDNIDDYSLAINEKIMRYNKEDKGIPVEERKPIKIFIDTMGGYVSIMYSIVKAIKLSKTPVWTINWCECYSAGAHILAAGHKRFAMPGSTVLIHSGSCGYSGDTEKVESAKKFFDAMGKEADELLLAMTKIDKKVFNKRKASDWYLTDKEALENGIIDKIIEDFDEIA